MSVSLEQQSHYRLFVCSIPLTITEIKSRRPIYCRLPEQQQQQQQQQSSADEEEQEGEY